MLNVPLIVTLDGAFKMWAARKYGLVGQDDEGLGVYKVHPSKWQDGDLEMLQSWDNWCSYEDERTNEQLEEWCLIADARGVKFDHGGYLTAKEKRQRKQMVYVGAGAAALFAWWLFKPRDPLGVKARGPVTIEAVTRAVAPIVSQVQQTKLPEPSINQIREPRQTFQSLPGASSSSQSFDWIDDLT